MDRTDVEYQFSLKSDNIQPAAKKYGDTAQGSDRWYVELAPGRSASDPLYFVLNDTGMIKRVVKGAYHSAAAAEGAEDITAQIMPKDRSQAPYGYEAVYAQDRNVFITVFFTDGTSAIYQLYATETSGQPPVAPAARGTYGRHKNENAGRRDQR